MISSLGHGVILPRVLLRFFQTNRLTPFGVYCAAAGTILTLSCAGG